MRWSLRLQKFCVTLATAGCLAGAGAALVWGLKPATTLATNAASITHTPKTIHPTTDDAAAPSPNEFAQLWDRPLRRALYDPPPPKPEVTQLPPLRLELLGTIIEPPNSMAIVRSEQGRTEYKRIGDSVGPADSPASVVEIGAREIIVQRTDERITLRVQTSDRR